MTVVSEDVKSLEDGELFDRLSAAIKAIPPITESNGAAWRRAWDHMRRYHDELARRYASK